MSSVFDRKPATDRPVHRPMYTPGPIMAIMLGTIFYITLFGALGWLT